MLNKLLQFLEIDDAARAHARLLWATIGPQTDSIVERFYERVHEARITRHINSPAISRLKVKQKAHWAALFDSNFDDDYANSVRRIGLAHRDIALDPLWHVVGYMAIKIQMTEAVAASELTPLEKSRLLRTLDKYVAIDMGLALSAYNAAVLD